MKRLFIVANGTLKRKNNTVALETKEGTKYAPITSIGSIYVFGEVRMNKRLLQFLSRNHVPIHFFGKHYLGSFYPRLFNASGFMVLKQVKAYMDPKKRGVIARKFVEGAIKNLATVLRENNLQEDASKLREYISLLTDDWTPSWELKVTLGTSTSLVWTRYYHKAFASRRGQGSPLRTWGTRS